MRVEHFHRDGEVDSESVGEYNGARWLVQSYTRRPQAFALPHLEISLTLSEIYDGVDVPEDLRLIPDLPDLEDN